MSFEQELEQLKQRSGLNEQADRNVQQALALVQRGMGVLIANREATAQMIQQLKANPKSKPYAEALEMLMQSAGQFQLPA